MKARLQVAGALSSPSSGIVGSSAALLRTEGLRGLFRGFGFVALGVAPANAAYFCGYELGGLLAPPGYTDLARGLGAQLLGGVVYTPVDLIKERMQVQSMLPGSPRQGAWEMLLSIYRSRGAAGLFKASTQGSALPLNQV